MPDKTSRTLILTLSKICSIVPTTESRETRSAQQVK